MSLFRDKLCPVFRIFLIRFGCPATVLLAGLFTAQTSWSRPELADAPLPVAGRVLEGRESACAHPGIREAAGLAALKDALSQQNRVLPRGTADPNSAYSAANEVDSPLPDLGHTPLTRPDFSRPDPAMDPVLNDFLKTEIRNSRQVTEKAIGPKPKTTPGSAEAVRARVVKCEGDLVVVLKGREKVVRDAIRQAETVKAAQIRLPQGITPTRKASWSDFPKHLQLVRDGSCCRVEWEIQIVDLADGKSRASIQRVRAFLVPQMDYEQPLKMLSEVVKLRTILPPDTDFPSMRNSTKWSPDFASSYERTCRTLNKPLEVCDCMIRETERRFSLSDVRRLDFSLTSYQGGVFRARNTNAVGFVAASLDGSTVIPAFVSLPPVLKGIRAKCGLAGS
jgi:hypothetical protein